ncbi:MAG TPA: circadian clock protein KaiC [Gemmatimonadaceae bacterium]|nr:circadian clock protein KaiC [Gemmatimonadaceae bacterium]
MPEVRASLAKTPSGIRGLDEITSGGLPRGRPTLVCGGPGCGKTLFAMEFLVRGATEYDEPGVFMAFEETSRELAANVASLGFDLEKLQRENKLHIDYVRVERHEIEETGEYDLEGLFVRLGHAIDKVGAKRVVLDTVETLFSGFMQTNILRAELRRLFGWLKERGVTAIITGERGSGDATISRQGLEEYVSDCVIVLDHRVDSQISTRRLRIVKYRGTSHGTNEFPFLIDTDGFVVIPITSATLNHDVSDERISSGIPELDEMIGGQGYFRGSSILLSGTAGTGKTLTSLYLAKAAAERGERVLYHTLEESPAQIVRNARSVGLDLRPALDRGLLRNHAVRPSMYGLETHLAHMLREIDAFDPSVVIFDPLTALVSNARPEDVSSLATRLIDWLKTRQITSFFTSLSQNAAVHDLEHTNVGISSLVDTWMFVRDIELHGERNRGIFVLKSRGMKHSNQIREFIIDDTGIRIVPAYLGIEGVLTGSARAAQEIRERELAAIRSFEAQKRQRQLDVKRAAIEAQIAALRADLVAAETEFRAVDADEERQIEAIEEAQRTIARSRLASPLSASIVARPGNGSTQPENRD